MTAAVFAAVLAGAAIVASASVLRVHGRSGVVTRAGAADRGGIGRARPSGETFARWSGPGSCLLGGVAGVAFAGVPGAIVGAGGGLALTVVLRRRRTARALARVEEQLADAVGALTAALRAGMSLSQALAYAANETDPPLGGELHEIVERASIGEPVGEVLSRWSREHGGPDARLMVGVLRMHRRSGGDLPGVLDRLAATLRERRATHRELRSLTAQARLSGGILGFLPIGFFAFLGLTAPDDLSTALSAPAGRTAIVVGFVLQGAAFAWIRRLLRVA